MNKTFIFSALIGTMISLNPLPAAENTITCKFEDNLPFGVSAWSQSERVRQGLGKETGFRPYAAGSADDLAADALVQRGGEAEASTDPRETAFWQAYDADGWYIYIQSKEPLVKQLVRRLRDPRSRGKDESYEVFFAPGLEDVPYYQILINPYLDKTTFYDWGMPSPDYRSLKSETRVESLPLEDGVGTFIFIPWHLLYEHAPLEGGEWRFSLIRWMPFAKAGGVTWGGRVHETGQFGRVHFEKPTATQRLALERRLLEYAWFKFLATAGQIREFVGWDDEYVGDPEFYEKVLAPQIERMKAIAAPWGDPEQWTAGQVREGMRHLKEFMEFDDQENDLRARYLNQKMFTEK